MEKNKKYNILSIVAVVFCAIGIILMIAQKFIESEINLSIFSNICMAIGLFSFVFIMGSKKSN